MEQALFIHTLPKAAVAQDVDRAALQHTGPDTGPDVTPAFPLQDNTVHTLQMQQMRQQQPRRAGPDNGDFGFKG